MEYDLIRVHTFCIQVNSNLLKKGKIAADASTKSVKDKK